MAKLLGFHRWRPRYVSTYFDAIAINAPSANGQRILACGLISSARLIPVMYALARFATRPRSHHDNRTSAARHTPNVVISRGYPPRMW